MDTRTGGSFTVLQVVHVAFQERVLREQFDHAEGGAADCENVHAAVFVAFNDVENFGGAADSRHSLGKGEKHAELGLFFQRVFHHFAVTWLENMQGKLRAGKEDDVQRKQRNAFRPHGSQST